MIFSPKYLHNPDAAVAYFHIRREVEYLGILPRARRIEQILHTMSARHRGAESCLSKIGMSRTPRPSSSATLHLLRRQHPGMSAIFSCDMSMFAIPGVAWRRIRPWPPATASSNFITSTGNY